MAVLIVFIVFLVVGIVYFKKKKDGGKGHPPMVQSDNLFYTAPCPSFYKDIQYAVRLFDFVSDFSGSNENAKTDSLKFCDKLQDYIDEMTALYSRRDECFAFEFIKLDYGLLVIFKHWTNSNELD